jgi:hypothetical protein
VDVWKAKNAFHISTAPDSGHNRRTETVDLMRRARNLEMERDIPFDRIQLIDEDDPESGEKAGTV